MNQLSDPHNQNIFSVTRLTREIKSLLEKNYPIVWITGEISNYSVPASGHSYFTLKDENAQISAVMFKGQSRNLKFAPDNGMEIVGMGRISLYEPRGTYQIIFEYIEPKGIGALQAAFEQLKTRLHEEGLFDDQYKKNIPYLPSKISIITSPTGAVIHDIIHIINRRFPNVHLEIVPSKVQGHDAVMEIIAGIERVNSLNTSDVIILARGGGSLEDLFPFNSEDVARAIFNSTIPVISAVGHETDYTIADFVADLRAPTPSAAAEIVLPLKMDLKHHCQSLLTQIVSHLNIYIKQKHMVINELTKHLTHPKKKIDDLRIKIDDLNMRLQRQMTALVLQKKNYCSWKIDLLLSSNPLLLLNKLQDALLNYNVLINSAINGYIKEKRFMLQENISRLNALNPKAILNRGYSITRTVPDAKIIKDPNSVQIDQQIEIIVEKGTIACQVKGKKPYGKENI